MENKHILTIEDFSREEIMRVISEAEKMIPYAQEQRRPPIDFKDHKPKVTLLFAEPSTRTCYSNEEAARLLGFYTTVITDKEMTSLAKNESFADTVRMLAGQGANVLVIRTSKEGASRFASEILEKSGYNVSVHNGGDGANKHPTQALLNYLTIFKRLGRLDNFTYGAVNDLKYSRVMHSVIPGLKMFNNIKIRLVSTPETKLPKSYTEGFEEVLEGDSFDLLADCDVIDVSRIQKERYTDQAELQKVIGKFVITKEILDKKFKKDVIIMHALPRGEEIHPEISDDPRIAMFYQADLGIPLRMLTLIEGYNHRSAKNSSLTFEPIQWDTLTKETIDAHLTRRQKANKYFRPITNGMVIDHLSFDMAGILRAALKRVLKAGDGKVIHLINGVPSESFNLKDLMVLENLFIDDNARSAIAFLSPTATFNIIREENFEKLKIKALPGVISEFLKCPNPICISNSEPEAITRFSPYGNGEIAECHFCNRRFSREEMWINLRRQISK